MKSVRVLAVADATSLTWLKRWLRAADIDVVATASSATSALTLARGLMPDVLLVDLELSPADLPPLLVQLAREQGAPILACVSRDALAGLVEGTRAAGAIDVVERPHTPDCDAEFVVELTRRIVSLSSRRSRPGERQRHSIAARDSAAARARVSLTQVRSSRLSLPEVVSPLRVIAIGASTGGTHALAEVLKDLPQSSPGVLVVQHMLSEFTRDFAERLNEVCALQVRLASGGELVKRGQVLIAPGGQHMRLGRDLNGNLCVFLSSDAPVGKHRPAVDVLFLSCAELAGRSAAGVLLTGLGEDGARGLLAMRAAGAHTIAQDQASSACFGMPSAAIKLGAASEVLPLTSIARGLIRLEASSRSSLPARE